MGFSTLDRIYEEEQGLKTDIPGISYLYGMLMTSKHDLIKFELRFSQLKLNDYAAVLITATSVSLYIVPSTHSRQFY